MGENPILSGRMPRTPLRGSYQTASLSSFDLSTPRCIIALWIKRSVANGIRSFWICDYQENVERFRYFAQIAKAEGAEVVTALMYTASPAHTEDHWAQKVKRITATKECVDRIMIEDAAGSLTPARTRALIHARPAELRGNSAGVSFPLQFGACASVLPGGPSGGCCYPAHCLCPSGQRNILAGNGNHPEKRPPFGI
jgi:hypothetical protein